jgi:hypothetical protein
VRPGLGREDRQRGERGGGDGHHPGSPECGSILAQGPPQVADASSLRGTRPSTRSATGRAGALALACSQEARSWGLGLGSGIGLPGHKTLRQSCRPGSFRRGSAMNASARRSLDTNRRCRALIRRIRWRAARGSSPAIGREALGASTAAERRQHQARRGAPPRGPRCRTCRAPRSALPLRQDRCRWRAWPRHPRCPLALRSDLRP